ncbi:hypothetical protein ES332_D06G223100v1 [Gossypium tomentosum]|uniref:Uncharacterized protein n=1 Tax=Gossypium tomentosum TaxID=34277 RepID=A0A5D2KM59_GOSTO|nr:hypothetical protein ES332_D06G223100v1 [Gossypium tomentosum]
MELKFSLFPNNAFRVRGDRPSSGIECLAMTAVEYEGSLGTFVVLARRLSVNVGESGATCHFGEMVAECSLRGWVTSGGGY